jgi:hypothetical protein
MLFRNRSNEQRTVTTIGLACLAIAGISRMFLHPSAALSQDLADGIQGFLYGISIALLLRGVWLKSHQRSASQPDSCGS